MTNCAGRWQVECILNCSVPALTVNFYVGLYSSGEYSCSGNGSQSVIWNDKVCEAQHDPLLNSTTTIILASYI